MPIVWLIIQSVLALAAVLVILRWRLYRPVPDRLTLAEAETSPPIPPMVLLLAALLLMLANYLGAGTAAHLLETNADQGLRGRVLVMLGHYSGFAIGLAALAIGLPGLLGSIGVRPRAREGARGAAASVLLIPVVIWIATLGALLATWLAALAGQPPPSMTAHEGLVAFLGEGGLWWRVLFGALVVVAAPIAEEAVYRGLVQTAFLRASRSAWLAIIATSTIFTVMHVPVVEWFALPALFALSVGLGVCAERTRGLTAPIVIHGAFNLLNLNLALLSRGG